MSWNQGFFWPWGQQPTLVGSSTTALDATGEYVAIVGRIAIEGRATGKTLNTTGSSSIRFFVSAGPVFDAVAPSSEFTVGFRGVDKTTGLPVRPDASWATEGYARAAITQSANTTPPLTDNSNTTGHVVVPTAGTITLDHGDEVCFVLEMTTRNGSDSVTPTGSRFTQNQYPASPTNVTGSVVGNVERAIAVIITFSDGTKGTIEGVLPGVANVLVFDNADDPDEHGMIFQVPFACNVDAMMFYGRPVGGAAADFEYDLTSTPEGTPVSLIGGPITFDAENQATTAADGSVLLPFAAEVSLLADTDYCMAIKATSTGDVRWPQLSIGDADAREFLGPGGLTMRAVSRNNGTGAYAPTANSTTILNPLAVRISEVAAGGGITVVRRG